ncbi:CC_3452 family protein [Phenylobacterium sp.]|uniref:CC_3452 family protein n=1 Tax=Phenylobacterium sp. TaxID=1871053 RepID=UPI00374D116D
MKLLTLAAACAVVVTFASAPAFAAESVVAKLAAPVAQPTKFIAGEAMFNCEGDTCVAASPQSLTFSAGACKTVAAKVGTLVSFTGRVAMDDQRLGACNSVAVARSAGPQMAKQ